MLLSWICLKTIPLFNGFCLLNVLYDGDYIETDGYLSYEPYGPEIAINDDMKSFFTVVFDA